MAHSELNLLDQTLMREIDHCRAAAERRRQGLTAANWPAYRSELRERLLDLLGPFPERAPLRPRVTGVLERDGYRVEKLLFDSRPDFPVTANLYLPTGGDDARPAVLLPSSGAVEGKSYASYQAACQGLVRKGFAVLCYDSMGLGERSMYVHPETGEDLRPRGTAQRRVDAHRAFLLGSNLVSWEVWDGIRALDYLESRPEVDPSRIGSAGGRLVGLLGAVDERIQVIAAAGAVGTLRHRFERNAPLDPAWLLPGAAAQGIDDVELLALFAPRPLLLAAPREDAVLLDAARETHAVLRACYALLGDLDRLEVAEVPAPPGFSRPIREEIYTWTQRWLLPGSTGAGGSLFDLMETEVYPEPEEALWSTPRGQAMLSPGGETVYRLLCAAGAEEQDGETERRGDSEAAREQLAGPPASPSVPPIRRFADSPQTIRWGEAAAVPRAVPLFQQEVRESLRRLACPEEPEVTLLERAMAGSGGSNLSDRAVAVRFCPIPGVELAAQLLMPADPPSRVVLWIPGDGALASAERVRASARVAAVLALEPRGLAQAAERGDNAAHFGIVLGRPLLGIWLTDVLAAIQVLRKLPETKALPITLHGTGVGGILAAMAGALVPEVSAVEVEEALLSYRTYLRDPDPDYPAAALLPGGLHADLPAVAAAVAPRGFVLAAPVDSSGEPASLEAAAAEYALTGRIYHALGADGQFLIDLRRKAP